MNEGKTAVQVVSRAASHTRGSMKALSDTPDEKHTHGAIKPGHRDEDDRSAAYKVVKMDICLFEFFWAVCISVFLFSECNPAVPAVTGVKSSHGRQRPTCAEVSGNVPMK